MTPIYLNLLISIAVALAVGVLCTGLSLWLVGRGGPEVSSPPMHQSSTRSRWVREAIQAVHIPKWVRMRWVTSETTRRLKQAGTSWRASEYAAVRWGAIWVTGAIAALILTSRGRDFISLFLGVIVFSVAVVGPELWLNWTIEKRQIEVDLALPNLLDQLVLALEAGLGIEVSLRRTASNYPGLLGSEFRRFIRQLDRGHSRTNAFDELQERLPSKDLNAFVIAVKQTDRLGTSLARSLRVQTELLRARRRRRAQEAGRRLPILIVFPLVFLFLPALMIIFLAPPILHLLSVR